MEKEFVSYIMALKLKELGFDEKCLGFYYQAIETEWFDFRSGGNVIFNEGNPIILNYSGKIGLERDEIYLCKAPLYQQTLYWFREKHNYSGEVYYYDSSDFGKWHFDIEPLKLDGERYTTPVKEGFNTHQEAQEKLIEKLIEIVKNGTVENR